MAAPREDFVFGDVPVQTDVTVRSEKRATPEELVEMANGIWRQVRDSKIPAEDEAGNEALLEKIQKEHREFGTSFPIALRWMVQARKYNPKAFKRYLLKHAAAKLDTRESFLELQGEYLVYLYREENPHADENYIKRYRRAIIDQLLEEDKNFMELQKQVDADLKRSAATVDAERRKVLYAYLLEAKVAREAAREKARRGGQQESDELS